jgi:hypothetical protein
MPPLEVGDLGGIRWRQRHAMHHGAAHGRDSAEVVISKPAAALATA